MAIQIGKSWVSEAAYAHAQQGVREGEQGNTLQQLSKQYPHINFSTNTAPFQGKGTNNIAIAPNILREMENNPQKRMEYEALIYDCNKLQKSLEGKSTMTGKKIAAHGFIINSDGTLGSWSITKSSGIQHKSSLLLPKNDKQSWLSSILKDTSLESSKRYA